MFVWNWRHTSLTYSQIFSKDNIKYMCVSVRICVCVSMKRERRDKERIRKQNI